MGGNWNEVHTSVPVSRRWVDQVPETLTYMLGGLVNVPCSG